MSLVANHFREKQIWGRGEFSGWGHISSILGGNASLGCQSEICLFICYSMWVSAVYANVHDGPEHALRGRWACPLSSLPIALRQGLSLLPKAPVFSLSWKPTSPSDPSVSALLRTGVTCVECVRDVQFVVRVLGAKV